MKRWKGPWEYSFSVSGMKRRIQPYSASSCKTYLQKNKLELLLERVAKGSAYFMAFMEENLKQVLFHLAEVERLTRTKTYRNALSEIDQQIILAWGALEQAEYICKSIISDQRIIKTEAKDKKSVKRRAELWEMAQHAADAHPKLKSGKSGRKRKKGVKPEKGESSRITYGLVKEGLSIKEIAEKRNLAASTIEGHVVKGIRDREVDISSLLSEETVQKVARILQESSGALSELYNSQNGKYSHGVLRMVQAHLQTKEKA